MEDFFKDIFEYHHHMNQTLIDVFLKHHQQVSERTPAMFSHCLNAHQIWNSRILETTPFEVHQLHPLENFKIIDTINYRTTLKIIDTYEFGEPIVYLNSKGEPYENSVQDILFHIANHHTHHKGQLISDLRKYGIKPPVTDYIFYKR
ncbi:DinB family protein [Mangrovimonas sp. TPBH4]|uniref:DinB family protein n=1 Tax=Mangrovimonas sp. TPBH4 TaxID=1645914 RepID=UPI0009EC0A25|nr:DinB family protein [Mangrovimonas sp. TPBH4]